MKKPILSTYCSSLSQITQAIHHGYKHLILEDPLWSIRYRHTQDRSPLSQLASAARTQDPSIALSIQVDFLAHDSHFSTLNILIEAAKTASISHFRVQDPGLSQEIKSLFPEATFTLISETGNLNKESIAFWEPFFLTQQLSNELPHTDLLELSEAFPKTSFELQIHGPILLQYSYRRFMDGVHPGNKESYLNQAEDTQYPGRKYTFYDNPHGHFMTLYFDRCLFGQLILLNTLPLSSWIVDVRGESQAYAEAVLQLYAQGDQQDASTLWETVKTLAPRPLRPGFFLANRTDQERDERTHEEWEPVGIVLDVEKGKNILVEITEKCEGNLVWVTPDSKVIVCSTTPQPLTETLVVFPYQKGVLAQTKLMKG